MRRFGTEGRLYPEDNYIVPRTKETADFIDRIKQVSSSSPRILHPRVQRKATMLSSIIVKNRNLAWRVKKWRVCQFGAM